MSKRDYLEFQKFGEKLALKAGSILLEHRNKASIQKRKSDYLDIVTDADLASEKYLTEEIHKKYPDHNTLTEEHGDEMRRSDFNWIIDPLDGTKEFIRGTPIFNVSIALEYKEDLVAGVSFRPVSNELFSCSKDNGAYLNGRQLHVSSETDLKNSMIWTHLPHYKNSEEEINFSLALVKYLARNCYRVRAFPEDVATLSWLSLGGLEGFILNVNGPKWWDVAPGILMVREAGGKVTNLEGDKLRNRDLSKGIVASNGKIHDQLLKIISKYDSVR